ncbi:type II toxin-antitoxin system Y4mF family antitoxin [Archangium primigenium]|uniref:type II toxin-antitoxin system Y4mF family antitoxin n=1 Tax=[Archangium] primigenium TaxID=2792470 RepID=UPI00195654FD|nr:type II toxin-antitoxin system Y4mF family antitoxin [Archangium primigenium]MBM7113366.1 helix-turn-helix transcriptional regulator [Archangium primigenium]
MPLDEDPGAGDSWIRALAQAVRKQRKALGLTQEDLSALAGCGTVFIHDLESGRKPTLRLNKLVDVLEVLGLQLTLEPGKQRIQVSDHLS